MTDDNKKDDAKPEQPEQPERMKQPEQNHLNKELNDELAKINPLLKKGVDLLTTGRYDDARQAYASMKALSANISPAVVGNIMQAIASTGIARTYQRQGDYKSAIENCDESINSVSSVLEAQSLLTDTYALRGECYAQQGDFARALADHNKSIELGPKNTVGYVARADTYALMGKYQQAVADYNRASEISPESAYVQQRYALFLAKWQAKETAKKFQAAHEKSLAAYTQPEKIRERFDEREAKYQKMLDEVNTEITRQYRKLLLLIVSMVILALLGLNIWPPLAFYVAKDIGITVQNVTSYSPLEALPLLLVGFAIAFPFIWRLRDLHRQRQILQMCIEDYFRKGILLEHILISGDDKEMRQAFLKESHRHFANRSPAEFLAALGGKIKLDDDTGHPVIDAAKRAVDKADRIGGE